MALHDGRKKIDPNKKSWFKRFKIYLVTNKKKIRNFFIFLLLLVILLFPVWSGNLIGNWIKDFIGTILNAIYKI